MKKVVFINITLLIILIYVCTSYNHRQAIVNTERPIDNFSVLEINCSSGYRGGSTLLVEYNAKNHLAKMRRYAKMSSVYLAFGLKTLTLHLTKMRKYAKISRDNAYTT